MTFDDHVNSIGPVSRTGSAFSQQGTVPRNVLTSTASRQLSLPSTFQSGKKDIDRGNLATHPETAEIDGPARRPRSIARSRAIGEIPSFPAFREVTAHRSFRLKPPQLGTAAILGWNLNQSARYQRAHSRWRLHRQLTRSEPRCGEIAAIAPSGSLQGRVQRLISSVTR
jgi:hypothetical protein